MNKIIKIIVNTILIIMIFLLSIYAILKFTNKVEIFKVQTGSMEEGIHIGDYILIIKNTKYKLNDVVTFKRDNYYVTHRIIKENGDKVITKGDANNIEDDEISKSDIIGKVIAKGGLLNIVVRYKYVLVCIFLSIYLFTYYFDKGNNKKKEIEKEKIQEKQ